MTAGSRLNLRSLHASLGYTVFLFPYGQNRPLFAGAGTTSYPMDMDHLEVLREKIARLRAEIAQIQELNNQYRRQYSNETDAQIAHGQRHERLQAIQQELAQLADLGRKVRSVEEMKEKHRFRLDLIKKASQPVAFPCPGKSTDNACTRIGVTSAHAR